MSTDYSNVETRLFINNEYVPSSTNTTFQLYNPSTEEPTVAVHEASDDDVLRAVEFAKAAQKKWALTDSHTREAAIRELAKLIVEEAAELSRLDTLAMGVLKTTHQFHVQTAAALLNYFAGVAHDITGSTSQHNPSTLVLTLKQPYGVTAAIVPWNAPLVVVASSLGPSVVAGNSIIVKSSEKAPLAVSYLGKLIQRTPAFPPGLIQILPGRGPATGAALAKNMDIRKLSFTGSTRTGKLIKVMAAQSNLKNVQVELGGKSPMVIFEDADLDKAAAEGALSIGVQAGQVCVASSRVYVQESIKEKFLEKYTTILKQILGHAGNPMEESTTHPPQADELQFKAVTGFLERAKKDGIQPVVGGEREGQKGFYVKPTVFVDVPDDHELVKNEIFGPVSAVQTFKSEEEVLARANDTEYGLYASVYTKDLSRAFRIAQGLEAGSIGVNVTSPATEFLAPFTGFKQSGEGIGGGTMQSLNGWLEQKTVHVKLD